MAERDAAPDLLTALKMIIEDVPDEETSASLVITQRGLERIRAAIAKAEH